MAKEKPVKRAGKSNATDVVHLPRRDKPKLGQNFLRDTGAARRIVEALGDIGERTVIEIGPGPGILTELLAGKAQHLIAVELDRILAAQLRMKVGQRARVEIIEADVLTVNFRALLAARAAPQAGIAPEQVAAPKASVIGNLPYYITSDILLRLFELHGLFDQIVIMVQREVAERIAAEPGSRDYGLLSATAQLHARVETLFTLPPDAFVPPPQVHSSVLRLTIAPQWEVLRVPLQPFVDFLKLSFGQKRKTLVNNLKARYGGEALRHALKAAGVKADARAEAIGLEKMAVVFRELPSARAC